MRNLDNYHHAFAVSNAVFPSCAPYLSTSQLARLCALANSHALLSTFSLMLSVCWERTFFVSHSRFWCPLVARSRFKVGIRSSSWQRR